MMRSATAMLFGVILTLATLASGSDDDQKSCLEHVRQECSDPGSVWSDGPCNSVYGGFMSNFANFQYIINHVTRDSFKLLLLSNHFSTDESNRMGIHKVLMEKSDQMWEQVKDTVKYVTKRGGQLSRGQGMESLTLGGLNKISKRRQRFFTEVDALAVALDILKTQAEEVFLAYKQSMNRGHESSPGQRPNGFDPSVSDFYEDVFVESNSENIRELAGMLNILGKLTKDDSTRAMGIHMFDSHLRK